MQTLHGTNISRRSAAHRPPAAPQLAIPRVGAAVRAAASATAPAPAPAPSGSTLTNNGATINWHQLKLKHVVDSGDFNRAAVDVVFKEALKMEKVKPHTKESRILDGFIMSTLFYEPSTRTRLSFESAMSRLGGTVLSTESAGEYSSAAKGETLEDTIRTVEGYADCIVIRHFQEGAAARAAAVASIPILNAGDGPGQHPTQALLDLYTIQREIGRLDGIKVGMVGDLANGRTVRSLCMLLSMYSEVQVYFVAPEVVRMREDIKHYLSARGVRWTEVSDLREVAADVDVLYQTRIQRERFQNMDDYAAARGKYIIDKDLMRILSPNAVVLHPLPRVDEITTDVDSDPRAAYFRQARNGLYVRMALLKLCLADGHPEILL
ncbi:Belongs to the ATCase OTCase [Pleodorina starrii]|uniref:aspartate carbamoyltransferase n=1 Tax=Pleodorina starrii TaxID=330485 RepID=A0A9W6BB15_9CHLO|nr:Belongs to the ATCase OTCase [Pleodorina starrii]GLC48485.1 Belongs to the ATCase OTCase [Pleodorina starrii]GLC71805.1 Belongs to the ATCase OTCase [Pleodorina starrii]